mgnify:CR=1 FL=1
MVTSNMQPVGRVAVQDNASATCLIGPPSAPPVCCCVPPAEEYAAALARNKAGGGFSVRATLRLQGEVSGTTTLSQV